MKALIRKIYHKFFDNRYLRRALKVERRKINDPRRQAILRRFELTREQEAAIDKLYIENYGKKVPYDWHRYFSSYTGRFDPNFIPELIYIPIIEKKFNDKKYTEAFSDKNLLPLLISGVTNVRTPISYVSCVKGVLRDESSKLITKEAAVELLKNKRCFAKPTVDSNSGKMCSVFNFENGVDLKTQKTVGDVIDSMGGNFCFQELVQNCESVRKLHESSLNTFRITTYLWNGKVYHFPVIMRIGQGKAILDNAHQGGMFIGLSDDGVMNECAFTEFQDKYIVHPDSEIVFKDYRVPEVKLALEAVELVHQSIPQLGMISWDAVVNDSGEVIIIEMNVLSQSVWLPQMAHGVGAFGENTADILKWVRK